jgi:flagellar biosynthesis component FlhA
MNKKGMIANLIGGFIAIAIGITLYKPVTEFVKQVQANMSKNDSSAFAVTIMGLTPGFFALAILCMGIAIVWGALKDAGVFGDEPSDEDEEIEEEEVKSKPKKVGKQTYKEYVKERLEVEKMIHDN